MEARDPGVYLKALRRALTLAGGKAALGERLGVPLDRLEAWLEGAMEPPVEVFLKLVDLICTPPAHPALERLSRLQSRTAQLATRARRTIEQSRSLLESVNARRLQSALQTALAATGAERGNIQIVAPQGLRIAAQIGFEQPFLDFFACVGDARSACGAAMSSGARVIVPNVAGDALFAGAPRAVMLEAGARAVQSTPILARSGALLGMLSTHYERPYRPSDDELGAVDCVVADTAEWLDAPSSA